MKDIDKTKEQLISELEEMRQRTAELDALTAERKQVGKALQKSEKRYRLLTDNAADVIWTTGLDMRPTYMSPSITRLLGYSVEEAMVKTMKEVFTPASYEVAMKVFAEELAIEKMEQKDLSRSRVLEFEFKRKDGSIVPVEIGYSFLRGDDAQPVEILAIARDITERKQMEKALKENEEKLQRMFESATDGIVVTDLNGNIMEVNEAAVRLHGSDSKEKLIGQNTFELIAEKDRVRVMEILKNALEDGQIRKNVEITFLTKDGREYFAEVSSALLKDAAGNSAGFIAIFRDITERKQAEEALREEKQRAEEYLDIAGGMLATVNADENIIMINQKGCEILGYKEEELIGKNWFDTLVPQRIRGEIRGIFRKLMAGDIKPVEYYENPLLTKDGEERLIAFHNTVIRDPNGQIVGVLFSAEDITERKQAEEALSESEGKYRKLFELGSDALFLIEVKTGRILDLNDTALKMYGYSREEALQMKNTDFSAEPAQTRQATVEHEQQIPVRYHKKKDGTIFPTDISVAYFTWYEKKVCIAAIRDITERKKAEEEIRKSRAQLQAILDGSPDGIRQVDTGLKILWANQATLHRNPEALGQTCYKAMVNRDKPCEDCPSLHAMKTGKIERGVIYQPASSGVSGECHWEGTGVPIKDAEGKIVGAIQIIRNITERKRAEDEIRFAYAELEQIFETAADAMRVIDKDYYVLRMNKKYETLSGISRDEAVGKKCYEVLAGNLCHTPGCPLTRILNGEEFIEQEGEKVLNDGTRIPCITSATPFRGPDGKLLGIVGNIKDITERKQMEAERREMEQKAQITSRLATVGEMASGIAHEINNPLTSVIGFAELLTRRDLPEDIKNDLEIIHTGAKRVASIISRLLTFARQRKPERTYANINELVENTIGLRAYELKTGNIKVTPYLDPDLPQTIADTGQLQQVFLNIILNAETEMKTAHGGGNLTVKTERLDNTIRISFKDDGPGIAKENLEKVFNPFFTTREVGEGTGLGLSICHGIVTEHKGRIYVKSRLGKGATFIIELPVIAEAKQLELVESTGEAKTVSGAKILIVDDELAVLQFLDQLLTDEGYEVETAETASDALKRIKSKEYGVLLLDIKLPDMNGTELYRRIQKIAPSLANRVVFVTGDVMGARTTEFLAKTKVPYITKPINIEQLTEKIDSILS